MRLARADMPSPGRREGSGILLVGGGKYWPGVVIAVKMLRETGCALPVQIWHRGLEEPVRRADLAGLADISIHDLTTLRPVPRILGGWEAKTVALLACGWERVFFQDADAYCLADPTPLVQRLSASEPFLYWEDHPGATANIDWSVWDVPGSSVPPIQGGEFAIHVRHFWRELVLAHWIDQHSDFCYAHQYGDQDSWRVALTFSGGAYKCLDISRWDAFAHICDLDDKPFLVHRCYAKMFYPEHVTPENLAHTNHRLDRLPSEARVWAHFESLLSSRPASDAFGHVYVNGYWGPGERSGDGSSPEQARPYLEIINGLIQVSGWQRIIDLASGDGYITARLEAPAVVGVECHAPHVCRLRREAPAIDWQNLDIDRDRDRLPAGDVALLKDVLNHWPNRLIRDWLAWARTCGKWRWLVCTQDHAQTADGADCSLGGHRPLNITLEPLRSLGLMSFCDYGLKSVLLLQAQSADG